MSISYTKSKQIYYQYEELQNLGIYKMKSTQFWYFLWKCITAICMKRHTWASKKERKIASFLAEEHQKRWRVHGACIKDVFCINAFSARGMFAIKRWLKGFQWLTFTLNLCYWFMGAHNTYFDLKLNTKTRKDQIFLLLRVGLNYI